MSRIFISYVHEDEEVARMLQWLIFDCTGISPFLSNDRWHVMAGEVWLNKITAALEEADVVVLMLSQRSVGRPWVNFEAGAAWLAKKPIIPCCYGNLSKDHLPHPYSAIQAVNLRKEPAYLLQSLCHHLKVRFRRARHGTPQGVRRSAYFDNLFKKLDEFQDYQTVTTQTTVEKVMALGKAEVKKQQRRATRLKRTRQR
jgi:hypothetical protein